MRFQVDHGGSFIEIIVSIALVGIIGTSLAPLFANMISNSEKIKQQSRLVEMGDYVGQYVLRWAQFSPDSKLFGIDFFDDGTELESLSAEHRINHLTYLNTLPVMADSISDEYKTRIVFWETDRVNRAVAQITVWYDTNLNNELDDSEPHYELSTIVTERR